MNCPHCGAEEWNRCEEYGNEFTWWKCESYTFKDGIQQFDELGVECRDRQISQLKAELSKCVRRDDPRLKEVLELIDIGRLLTAYDKLQSIIEGK